MHVLQVRILQLPLKVSFDVNDACGRSSPTGKRRRTQIPEVAGSNPACGMRGRIAVVAQFGRGRGMRVRVLWVRIPPAAVVRTEWSGVGGRSSPTGRGSGLKPRACGFESRLRHVAEVGRASRIGYGCAVSRGGPTGRGTGFKNRG